MKIVRNILIIIGWMLIVFDLTESFSMRSFNSSGGSGYSLGYVSGNHLPSIAAIILFLLAYFLKRKIKKGKTAFEMNSFLQE